MIAGHSVRCYALTALCVITAAVISGGSPIVLLLAATIAVTALIRRRREAPTPDSALAPPFAGPGLDHAQTLTELLGRVGSRVHVLAAARADGWGVVTLRGTLTHAGGVGTATEDVLFFAIGNDGGFFLPRARFHRAYHVERSQAPALALHIGEALVYLLDDEPLYQAGA
jgi:hypothetical protein